MKKVAKSLRLHRETLRALDPSATAQAVAGRQNTVTCNYSGCDAFPTCVGYTCAVSCNCLSQNPVDCWATTGAILF